MNKICPKCKKNDKEPYQSYCKGCRNTYLREKRHNIKTTEIEKLKKQILSLAKVVLEKADYFEVKEEMLNPINKSLGELKDKMNEMIRTLNSWVGDNNDDMRIEEI